MSLNRLIFFALLAVLAFFLSSCGPGQFFGPTITPTPTSTPTLTSTFTNTPNPTNTPTETITLTPYIIYITATPVPTFTVASDVVLKPPVCTERSGIFATNDTDIAFTLYLFGPNGQRTGYAYILAPGHNSLNLCPGIYQYTARYCNTLQTGEVMAGTNIHFACK
jgi:hypothetical protein